MKITIITVVRNNEKTIKDAINSVLSQTYDKIEYIIIDGESKDKTLHIIDNYKDKLGNFISEKDYGIYDAMNKGIEMSNGDIIGILNSDDLYYNNNIIDLIMNEFISNPSLDMIYGNLVYVKSDNVNKIIRYWKTRSYYKKYFEHGNVPPHPTLFLKKNVYDQVGYFNLNFKLAADYEFMLRVFKKYNYKSKYINKTFVKMRLGGATNKTYTNILKQNIEILNTWKYNGFRLPFFLIPMRFIIKLKQYIYK